MTRSEPRNFSSKLSNFDQILAVLRGKLLDTCAGGGRQSHFSPSCESAGRQMRLHRAIPSAMRMVRPNCMGIKCPDSKEQGGNDPRVKREESQQIVAALERRNGDPTYVLHTDQGHGFVRPEDRLDWTARGEKFLADRLGGRCEPMVGTDARGVLVADITKVKKSI